MSFLSCTKDTHWCLLVDQAACSPSKVAIEPHSLALVASESYFIAALQSSSLVSLRLMSVANIFKSATSG